MLAFFSLLNLILQYPANYFQTIQVFVAIISQRCVKNDEKIV